MKKLFTFFVGIILSLSSMSVLQAQTYWDQYFVNPNDVFTGWTAWPAGWSTSLLGGTTMALEDSIRFNTGTGGGNRGGDITFPCQRDSSVIYVEYDYKLSSVTVTNKNVFAMYLSNAVTNMGTANYTDSLISGVFLTGYDGKFHIWNKDLVGPVLATKPDTIVPVYRPDGVTSARGGVTAAWCDSINLSTRTDVTFTKNLWYHFKYVINFNTKKLDITITDKTDPLNTQTFTDLDFVSPLVNNVTRFGVINNRSNNTYFGVNTTLDAKDPLGNGNGLVTTGYLDSLSVYQKVASLGLADVTINYQDLDGMTIKTARVEAQQEVGLQYMLTSDDKASFSADGNYYAYDATATGSESVLVETGGSSIIVKFKKSPLTAGTYVWKGTYSDYWNELDPNFSTDGANSLGFQEGNGVSFSDANAPIKEVTQNQVLDLGANNLTVDVVGYTIKNGSGEILTGTGSIQVNASTNLGLSSLNKMPVYINKDTLTVSNAALAKKYMAASGTTINPRISLADSIVGPGSGTFTFIPNVATYTSVITGVSEINYPLSAKGNYFKLNGCPRMNNVLDPLAKLNVSTIAGDSTLFDSYLSYKNNYIHLGDSVYMSYSATPLATGATVQEIGELSGEESSALVGPVVRKMTYNVGGLNTDATFAGKFAPILFDYLNNSTFFNISKVGKGTWTLSGNTPVFLGNVNVLDGTLKVDGVLCNGEGNYTFGDGSTPNNLIPTLLVADTATLAGNGGFIGANSTVVNGTITGKLTLAGSISLNIDAGDGGATTIINVDGENIDKIKVLGDFNYGGKLKVNVISAPPAGSYQILEFSNYLESGLYGFDSVELPEGYTFDYTTGMLNIPTGVNNIPDASKEISTIEYFDMTGKQVTKDTKGFVIKRIKYTDGTIKSYKNYIKPNVR